jgi:hypothetical protein
VHFYYTVYDYAFFAGGRLIHRRLHPIGCLVGIITGVLLLSSCLTAPPQASVTDVENGIFTLVNEERLEAGLPALKRDAGLDRLAREYSKSGFSKTVEDSTGLCHLICNCWRSVYDSASPRLSAETSRHQVDFCLDSPTMLEAICRIDARASGVGVAIVGSTVFYTQAFDVLNVVRSNGQPLMLNENPQAQDPTWEQLKNFVVDDDTDCHQYMEGSFVCTEFAAMLHDRAEAARIRAAYVSVDFLGEPGHALNAFQTTDRGLVYIDCTGPGLNAQTPAAIDGREHGIPSYDKVAYMASGSEYGLLSIDQASSFDYEFYEEWQESWWEYIDHRDAYFQKLDAYEKALGGRTVITDPDEYELLQDMLADLRAMEQDLEAEQSVLGGFRWEPLSTVSDSYVHW